MSAAKPSTATPANEPTKSLAINMPKTGGKGRKILGAIKNAALPQVTGEAVANSLETLEKLGVKDDIEEEIQEHNSETAAEIDEEEKKITRRIYRIDLITTYLLFYTALTIQWLTLLGESNG